MRSVPISTANEKECTVCLKQHNQYTNFPNSKDGGYREVPSVRLFPGIFYGSVLVYCGVADAGCREGCYAFAACAAASALVFSAAVA